MIFYFSGTGNSKWVAMKVAEIINDKSYDITLIKDAPDVNNEKRIGFVFPVHAWGVPEPMRIFAKKLQRIKAFAFGICTYGADAGHTMKKFSSFYRLDSAYGIEMPNNYIIGEDLEEEDVVTHKLKNAADEILKISQEIINEKKVYRVNEGKFAKFKSGIINFGFNKFARSTAKFNVDECKCTGCGLCAEKCPSLSIIMSDGKPIWKGNCYQCMRCINICPQVAIQYGSDTVGRRRYTINKYLK